MTRWFLVLVAACGDNGQGNKPVDAQPIDMTDVDAPPDADPLATVQGTGLCDDPGCMAINSGIIEYTPRFGLYADGATKRRWVQLPAGSQIDTSDMDHWVFPVGTKFWKEFARDGVRVETRFITKTLADENSPLAWFFVTYQWNATQDSATALTIGAQDANGTLHNIPSRAQCKECHDGIKPGRVLGFQAIQLDGAPDYNLENLIDDGLLTNPPAAGTQGNRFPIPGSQIEFNAFAYFHANCGHCHNPTSATHDITPIELRLETTKLQLANIPAVKTTVRTVGEPRVDADNCGNNVDDDGDGVVDNGCAAVAFFDNSTGTNIHYDELVIPGDPALSGLLVRMKLTNNKRMPKIAVEDPDPAGETAITAWINSL